MSVAVYTMSENETGVWRYHHLMVAKSDGAIVPTHRHTYPHTTTCIKGSVKLWAEDGGLRELKESESYEIPAGVAHDLEFEHSGSSVECVHVYRNEDGKEIPFSYELSPREQVRLTGLL